MNIKVFMAFWIVFGISGVLILFFTGASYSSVTCITGHVVGHIRQCPECSQDSHCKTDDDLDRVCNLETNKCAQRACISLLECEDNLNDCERGICTRLRFDFD